jgi:hypothetical protein
MHITVFAGDRNCPAIGHLNPIHTFTHIHLYTAGHKNYITEKINNGKCISEHMIIVSSGAYARLAFPLNKF